MKGFEYPPELAAMLDEFRERYADVWERESMNRLDQFLMDNCDAARV